MFNVTVLRLKDIKKYLLGILFTIIFVIIFAKIFSSNKSNLPKTENKIETAISSQAKKIEDHMIKSGISQTITTFSSINEQNSKNEEKDKGNIMQNLLTSEINIMKELENNENKENDTESSENQSNDNVTDEQNNTANSNEIELAKTDVKTEVVTNNPISESFNVQYGNVKIKNQTSYTLTEEMLKPDITIENKNILMFHTHSCESYTSSNLFPYTPTGNYRTTDLNYTVTRVGTELEMQLKQYGFSTYHDMSYHDYPSYNGSYTKSLQTVQNILTSFPSDIIIDLHRDAIGSRPDYAPTVKIGENDYAAQIMYVIGTNAGGLEHPNWNQNLKFAIKVQEKAEELYPGLFKPIMLTESRYNQHTGKYASIMEIGATGNTLEQCLTSMKYLAKVLDAVINE